MKNQDKFYELLDTLKNGAYFAGTLALGTLGLACEGMEKAAEAVRLRCEAARTEGEMDGKLMEAGEMVYATHTGTPTESIDVLKARLAELNESLGRTAEDVSCPACGAAAQDGDHYCRACGGKLD